MSESYQKTVILPYQVQKETLRNNVVLPQDVVRGFNHQRNMTPI